MIVLPIVSFILLSDGSWDSFAFYNQNHQLPSFTQWVLQTFSSKESTTVLVSVMEAQNTAQEIQTSFSYFVIHFILPTIYSLVWLGPVWLLSVMLSGVWYQDIAEHAFQVYYGRPPDDVFSPESFLRKMTDNIYSIFLIGGGLLVQV